MDFKPSHMSREAFLQEVQESFSKDGQKKDYQHWYKMIPPWLTDGVGQAFFFAKTLTKTSTVYKDLVSAQLFGIECYGIRNKAVVLCPHDGTNHECPYNRGHNENTDY